MKKVLALLLLAAIFALPVQASYDKYVETAVSDGVLLGDENGNLNTDKPVTRGEFAVILTKFLNLSGGINSFSDVAPHDWFYDALIAANHYSIIMGDENGNARPYENIKRQDVVTMLGRFYNAKKTVTSHFEDVSDYALEYWSFAEANDLLTKNAPLESVTRGEILQLLYDYDNTDSAGVRFSAGYPRISEKQGAYGKISVDIRTNKPCDIYYSLVEKGSHYDNLTELLCKTKTGTSTVSIPASLNKAYDLYLIAINKDGVTSKISAIKDVTPFMISSGSGSSISPYVIYTMEQLSQIAYMPGKFYKLGTNIILNDNWAPISDFSGTLDGNGYAIRGLTIYSKSHSGLFDTLNGTVRNLTVYGNINAGKTAGIIAGENNGTIESCTVAGSISVNTDYAGAVCGINNGTVKNCLSALDFVTSGSFAGGIAGSNQGNVENCLAATNLVASDMYAGGIAGVNDGGSIRACVSACMTVHDVLTKNSGRITTNKNNGTLENNYFYLEAISDTMYEEPSDYSQNGYDASWNNLRDIDFYKNLGWSTSKWKLSQNGFRLINPKSAQPPSLVPGNTVYFPKPIKNPQELRDIDKNEAGHYILAQDIHLSLPWKIICVTNGFSGTLDGDGHTIYNLNLNTQAGFFSNITGGTVKNLTLKNVTSSSDTVGGILTACNYGYIDNCTIYGMVKTKKSGYLGSFAGLNHGAITNCTSYVDITNTYQNSTIGGICAESDGVIFGCTYRGKIDTTGDNTVVGGICGYETGGYISDSFSYSSISITAGLGYVGGICGMAEGTQIYKCASGGNIISSDSGTIYSGGICALAQNATIYNCYSLSEIHTFAKSGFAGGICGCNSASNIQNTYSAANILSGSNMYTGGICGYSENGFIMQNVALNPVINGGINTGAIFGNSQTSGIADNFSCNKTLINSQHIINSEKNGTIKNVEILKNTEFFCKPLSDGGVLGWPGTDVWIESDTDYPLPVLSGVNSYGLITPTYK